ncbi:hypothetical protein Y1Q_0002716 [Alligator mississippiensis]|uniref:Uncharacterized protein n=1 Tax=Alligator mississippiensis TaxID=8496 RepID=A0A151NYW1_ALLMI|nr:hypothetical protein Y1Q_0002716 [Alligator mississippiensis]
MSSEATNATKLTSEPESQPGELNFPFMDEETSSNLELHSWDLMKKRRWNLLSGLPTEGTKPQDFSSFL